MNVNFHNYPFLSGKGVFIITDPFFLFLNADSTEMFFIDNLDKHKNISFGRELNLKEKYGSVFEWVKTEMLIRTASYLRRLILACEHSEQYRGIRINNKFKDGLMEYESNHHGEFDLAGFKNSVLWHKESLSNSDRRVTLYSCYKESTNPIVIASSSDGTNNNVFSFLFQSEES